MSTATRGLSNGWTGGQYSVFRAALGGYLCIHFLCLLPWGRELFSNQGMLPDAASSPLVFAFPNVLAFVDGPAMVTALLLFAAGASALLAIGLHDRMAAILAWYVWACLLGRNPLISNPGIPYVGWLLLAHACLPTAPFGSLAARGRTDPAAGWRMPPAIFAAAWVLMALGYTYSGYTKLVSPSWIDGTALIRILENPLARPGPLRDLVLTLPDVLLRIGTWAALLLELLFAPLSLSRRLRPWIWSAALGLHLCLIALIDFADLSLGMVMVHLFTFDPAWIPRRATAKTETLFYDGGCGLCHGFVRFLLAEDEVGQFQFAPLGGPSFEASLPAATRAGLPDSLVLLADDGRTMTRSAAVLHIGHRLGGLWRVLATLTTLLPSPLLDRAYDLVARTRHRVLSARGQSCPMAPGELRPRLLS